MMKECLPKKVGRNPVESSVRKSKKFGYIDVKTDYDGWVDAKKYLPADYDLVFVKLKNKRNMIAWCFDDLWDGLELKETDEVLYWKRKPEDRLTYKIGMK